MSAPILAAEGLVAGYSREVDTLHEVSVALHPGEIVAVVGPNGAGKSTLIKALVGLVVPRRGRVRLRGEDLAGLAPHAIVRRGLAYVPQRDNVFPTMTVLENLELGAAARPGLDVGARIAAMLAAFPRLAARRRQAVGTMSGGERQMVAMARALMAEPAVLLLDEPSAGLAPQFVAGLFAELAAINRGGVAILLVEQNARQALELAHRGYVLELGRNRLEGAGRALLADPRLAELYLG